MSRYKKKKSHPNKSYQVVNEKSKTKRPKPPGIPQRENETISESIEEQEEFGEEEWHDGFV